jgi:hypothetical protein
VSIHKHKKRPRIYVNKESMPLRKLVKPYMVDSMLYKLGL